jgi:hypothetical protein
VTVHGRPADVGVGAAEGGQARRALGVFFEVVQRRGGYDGYGAAPVRLAAQHLRDSGRAQR